jgi:opacity protein-like surface antigen
MNARSKFALILAGLAIAIPQSVSAAPAPNAKLWNGTWHLDTAKSKFASSAKEQSETRTYQVSGHKVTMKSSSKDLSGKELNFSYTAGFDGKWYPMVGNPNANRISLTVVSGREIKAKSQLHGKLSVASTATVSADGKHLVIKRKMLRMKGAPTDVLEFDR